MTDTSLSGCEMCETTERAELLLPSGLDAPGAARAFARASGCSEHGAQVLDDALLLISELVANAVQHGGTPILLALECEDGGMKVRVRDGSPTAPQPRQASAADERGRGLALVDQISDAWGVQSLVDQHGEGKVVWFELRAPDARST